MASFAAACRVSARLTARQLRQDATARGFRTSAACLAAQNFTMPALSPTMTEGNIASWKVKEGDSFAAGDVLLEIETDKASMDVEAQDDGILAKIMEGDGSKGIQVGTRIGVIAEPGDDLSSLEIPAEDKSAKPSQATEESKPSQEKKPESSSESKSEQAQSSSQSSKQTAPKSSGQSQKQTYPLLPSVEHLMHEHGLDHSAIDKMTPTGPNNRLLKGDVLAYLGSISASYPTELSDQIKKLGHLDLSNIKLAKPAPAPKSAAPSVPEPVAQDLEVAVPISLKAVTDVQKRIESTLGVFLPLSTFIARATDVANDNLPRSKSYQPTADDLFNQVLGLDKISGTGSRGAFLPQITALGGTSRVSKPVPTKKNLDIIDILSGKASSAGHHAAKQMPGLSSSVNMFSVKVPKSEEKRAQVFLDRVKSVLESEPGRLVL